MTAPRVEVIEDPDRIGALAHPTRVAVLDALRSPNTAAGAARALGLTRQAVNYHVKALLDAGLIRLAEERRKGNFIEQVYESVAGAFVVSPRVAWSDRRRADALTRELPLERLVTLGDALQRDAVELLDRAAFDEEDIPCASVDATVHFRDEAARAAFIDEYLTSLRQLVKKYGTRNGDTYRVAVAVYPNTERS
ncbi:MAG TPA: helix-turn-helix domain-containing protein [Acidimicrobiia bacterium]|nr:helix-turn-helix domain-containing protein [Acidimicrobiia bacterium]